MTAWKDLFAELRRVYGNVSELLLDADRMLDSEGFDIAHAKRAQIGIQRSGSIDEPDWWAPQWVARFYQFRAQPIYAGPLLYVACVLADGGGSDYRLPEGRPVVTAGVLRFEPDPANWNWFYWNAKYWLWLSRALTSTVQWETVTEDEKLRRQGVRTLETFALPLEDITSRQLLAERVTVPLIERAGMRGSKVVEDAGE